MQIRLVFLSLLGNRSLGYTGLTAIVMVAFFINVSPSFAQEGCDWTASVLEPDASQGAVELVPDKDSYCEGEIVQITCLPNQEYRFDFWWIYSNLHSFQSVKPAAMYISVRPPAKDPSATYAYGCQLWTAAEVMDEYCDVELSILGGDTAEVNTIPINPVQSSSLTIHRSDALKILSELVDGWELQTIEAGWLFYDSLHSWADFPEEGVNPCIFKPFNICFTAADGSGSIWVGDSVHPPNDAKIVRNNDNEFRIMHTYYHAQIAASIPLSIQSSLSTQP